MYALKLIRTTFFFHLSMTQKFAFSALIFSICQDVNLEMMTFDNCTVTYHVNGGHYKS